MGYTFLKTGNLFEFTHTNGRSESTSKPLEILMENGIFFLNGLDKTGPLTFRKADIDDIGGSGVPATDEEVKDAIAACFPNSTSSGGGGGGGGEVTIQGVTPVSGRLPVLANINTGQTIGVSGNVEVTNDSGNPLPVSGSVSITGTPAVAVSSGSITATISGTPNVTPQATESHLGEVGGNTVVVAASFTRPSDTAPYTALDVVGNTGTAAVITFSGLARINGGSGYITKLRIMTDQSTNTARYRLHLYSVAVTAIADNSPFTLLWTNRANRIGAISVDAGLITEGTGSTAAYGGTSTVRMAYKAATGATAIYGILETLDAFTPASAQNFYIELTAENN
ncbi:MAG: hypothetical protein EOP56_09480 [Sphingobacteriales bacterium]|nr:MAG: hypothetical protein EOP56_09480 [Sphingobacteriales bacterium]